MQNPQHLSRICEAQQVVETWQLFLDGGLRLSAN
jgi:hypothetical protein